MRNQRSYERAIVFKGAKKNGAQHKPLKVSIPPRNSASRRQTPRRAFVLCSSDEKILANRKNILNNFYKKNSLYDVDKWINSFYYKNQYIIKNT